LGYSYDWIKANVAEGEASTADKRVVKTGVIQLPLINILGYEAKNWPFLILIDEGADYRNLLGRDLLSGFNYSCDNDEKIFKIARAKNFDFIWGKLPGQEIHEIVRRHSQENQLEGSRVFTKHKQ